MEGTKVDRSRGALIVAALAVLAGIDDEEGVGAGIDHGERIATLRDALPKLPEGYRVATEADEEWQLIAPNGSPIVGAWEMIPGTARVTCWTKDGPEYEGYTDVHWDGQEQEGSEVVAYDGEVWDESECIRVVHDEA